MSIVQSFFVNTKAPTLSVDILMVAGGGGSASYYTASLSDDDFAQFYMPGGGGGAGGLYINTGYSIALNSTLSLTIGAAGSGSGRGGNTLVENVFGLLHSIPGGGSGYHLGTSPGGSGAGGSAYRYSTRSGGGGVTGIYGNNGGNSVTYSSGGGGGYGAVGGNATASFSPTGGGVGGSGYNRSTFDGGATSWLASGGGGACWTRGSSPNGNSVTAGLANSGVGALANNANASWSTSGGSGLVIVRYLGSVAKGTGGSTYTGTVGGTAYYFHSFTGTGTFVYTG